MWDGFVNIMKDHPEIAVFASLGFGYYIGAIKFGKFSLGPVTGTLMAAVAIGQFDITIDPFAKTLFFLLFIFAIGYSVGPQFISGFRSSGLPQIIFAAVQCVLSLLVVYVAAKIAGLEIGYGAGLLAGSQTISASMGLATDALDKTSLSSDAISTANDHMPIAYAVTYIFGTVGTAWVLAFGASRLVSKDIVADCKKLEETMSMPEPMPPEVSSAWHLFELRAYRLPVGSRAVGLSVADAEQLEPDARIFVERIRRDGEIIDVDQDTVLQADDLVAVGGHRDSLTTHINNAHIEEVDDYELLELPVETVDVVVANKEAVGKTVGDLRGDQRARGVYLKQITHGHVELPILAGTELSRGDVLTLTGRQRHVDDAAKALGYADRPSDETDVTWMGFAVAIGAILGALTLKVGAVPLTVSTTGGALLGGIILGWLRSVKHSFGLVPKPAEWFMRSVGLNVFIAVVGITAGPDFVDGIKDAGISLFLWGIITTSIPVFLGAMIARYVFKFHPAIALGSAAGARTSTASLSLVQDVCKSKTPALGYTVTYAVGNTLLTIWGMVIIMLLA